MDESRLTLVIGVERMALIMRYLVYLMLASLFFMGQLPGNWLNLTIITAAILLHNALTHWVLWRHQYHLLFSRWNFLIYFAEISLVVGFTGADQSEAYVLFFFLIIGFSAYSQRFQTIIGVAVLCAVLYMAIIGIEESFHNALMPIGAVTVKILAIFVCGWLVASLSSLLRRVEANSLKRSHALAASEATLRTILDTTADPILVYDEQEFIIDANTSACRFLTTAREALLGKRIRVYLFDDGTLPQRWASLRARGEYHGELIMMDAEGGEHTVDLKARSFVREQQRYFVCMARDISEQKDYQEATRLANENLERLNRELRQLHALKAGLLGKTAQQLRGPLSPLLGYLDLLINEELGEITDEQRTALHTCRRSALRLLRVAEETPTFAEARRRED